jgi:hypothetical protein
MPMLIMLGLLQARGAWLAALGGVMLYLALFRRWLLALAEHTAPDGLLIFTTHGERTRNSFANPRRSWSSRGSLIGGQVHDLFLRGFGNGQPLRSP